MSIRLRYILAFAVLLLAFAIAAYRHIRKDLESRYREAVEENMVDQVQLVASLLSTGLDTQQLSSAMDELNKRRFQAQIYSLLKTQSHILVYVTDANGKVLYHSSQPELAGSDFSQWRDVALTLQGKYGARSTRTNEYDENTSVLHVAAPIHCQGQICGVVSLGKPVRDFQGFLTHARRRLVWWLAGASAILVVLGILVGFWVVSPLRRMEADLKAQQYVENYVQVLTHELKSPISSIMGAAEILESELTPRDRNHFLGNIRSEITRMRDLVSLILQVASLERKSKAESLEPVPFSELTASLQSSLDSVMHQKGVTIQWPAWQGTLIVDRLLFSQALHNLLLNAIEYSEPENTVAFTVTHGRDWSAQIQDQGPGIPDFALSHLFEKFYSLPKPSTGRKGTGLGLVFCREVLRIHGGTVSLQNHPQGGALATVRLPGRRVVRVEN